MEIIYTTPKKFVKYDNSHYLLYLNEEVVENYKPDECEIPPVRAYRYSGDQEDGSTMISATEVSYGAFVSGLIRKRYSESECEAIQSNMIIAISDPNHVRAAEFNAEFNAYQSYRDECKSNAQLVLR